MIDPSERTSHLASLSVEEIARQLTDGSLTSLSFVDNCLERVAALDEYDTPTWLHSITAFDEWLLRDRRSRRKPVGTRSFRGWIVVGF